MRPALAVKQVPLRRIKHLREEYLKEANCQIVHNSYHERGFTDSYAFSVGDHVVGYGSLTGPPGERHTIKELYLLLEWRELATRAFRQLIETSDATSVETQTNDPLLSVLFWDVAEDVTSDTILFADLRSTALELSDATFRQLTKRDRSDAFAHTLEPVGEWGVELDDRIVATGGLMYHYNKPYADIYMEVDEAHRRRGYGGYVVQELKRIARETGYTPAARCNSENVASRRTLERAGMHPCGRILRGRIAS